MDKIRENRLRRAASRQGLALSRSRRRDPHAIDFGGYMLVDAMRNTVAFGGHPHAFSADLDDIEGFLKSPETR